MNASLWLAVALSRAAR